MVKKGESHDLLVYFFFGRLFCSFRCHKIKRPAEPLDWDQRDLVCIPRQMACDWLHVIMIFLKKILKFIL